MQVKFIVFAVSLQNSFLNISQACGDADKNGGKSNQRKPLNVNVADLTRAINGPCRAMPGWNKLPFRGHPLARRRRRIREIRNRIEADASPAREANAVI